MIRRQPRSTRTDTLFPYTTHFRSVRAMLAGADGIVSVASNVVPSAFRRLADLARAGKEADAQALDARLRALYDFLGIESNPIPVKALLARRGVGRGLRLPLTELSAEIGRDHV